MTKKALVILAEGFEEIEATTSIDVLRRAAVEVRVAGLSGKLIKGAHGIVVQADVLLKEFNELPDLLVLPGGGPGSKNLAASKEVADWIKKMNSQKKLIGAICAAPAFVLVPTGILNGKRATCYPGCEEKFNKEISFSEERVVVDDNVITSRGPGTAMEFALKLVEQLLSRDKAEALKQEMLVKV